MLPEVNGDKSGEEAMAKYEFRLCWIKHKFPLGKHFVSGGFGKVIPGELDCEENGVGKFGGILTELRLRMGEMRIIEQAIQGTPFQNKIDGNVVGCDDRIEKGARGDAKIHIICGRGEIIK
jgi:hypothetical protein